MHEFLMSLIPWGTDAIVWVQGFRSPALDVFFKVVDTKDASDEKFNVIDEWMIKSKQ